MANKDNTPADEPENDELEHELEAHNEAAQEPAADAHKHVMARVLKAGAGKIHTGRGHVRGAKETHDRGEVISMPLATALSYEDRGWVEIED